MSTKEINITGTHSIQQPVDKVGSVKVSFAWTHTYTKPFNRAKASIFTQWLAPVFQPMNPQSAQPIGRQTKFTPVDRTQPQGQHQAVVNAQGQLGHLDETSLPFPLRTFSILIFYPPAPKSLIAGSEAYLKTLVISHSFFIDAKSPTNREELSFLLRELRTKTNLVSWHPGQNDEVVLHLFAKRVEEI
jgi:hypothetical protein